MLKFGTDFVLLSSSKKNNQMKLLLHTLFILAFSTSAVFVKAQDFHASTTKIEFDNGALQLTAKFFTADLEKAVGATVGNKDNFDSKVRAYCASTLTVSVNGSPVTLSYIGFETSEKSTRLYLKADKLSNIKDIEIKNSMLINVFPDQQNLVTFDINGVRKSFTAKKGVESGKISF